MKFLVPLLFLISVGHAAENQPNTPIQKPLVKGPKEIWVMVIDTGIGQHDRLKKNVQYVQTPDYVDTHGHGTHITGIVLYGNKIKDAGSFADLVCPNVKVFACKYYDPKQSGQNNLKRSIECVKTATKMNMDFINYSGGGTEFSAEEHEAYERYAQSGGTAVVAAGNERSNLNDQPYYPAMYGFRSFQIGTKLFPQIRLFSVQNLGDNSELLPSSNSYPLALKERGDQIYSTLPNNAFGHMTGTSQATAQVTHLLLKQRCKEIAK